ncbi:Flp family type IVb pilin [bacterium]|nr:Flp family type IVb pilin [bacterium]
MFQRKNDRGPGFVEYGLLLALIAIVCIAAVSATGEGVEGILNPTKTAIGDASQKIGN